MVNTIEIFILLTFFIKMTEEEINDLKEYIFYIETEKAKVESAVLRLKILCSSRSSELGEEIQEILNEISKDYVYDPIMNSVTLSGGMVTSLDSYIKFLQRRINWYDERVKKHQEELAQFLPKPSIQEINDCRKEYVNKIHGEIIPQMMSILIERLVHLRRNLTKTVQEHESTDYSSEATASSHSHSHRPSPSKKLLETIFATLEITDCDAIDRINDVFDEKSEEDILSNYGLVIILALSNIEGYSGESECSMNGQFSDDDSMFKKLFKSDSWYDLIRFPCLFFRAFEHPFIQCSLTFKNSCDKDELKKTLHDINDFKRILTFDDRWSHCNELDISPYLLHISSISRILELKDSK
jgi:hypothetical protein